MTQLISFYADAPVPDDTVPELLQHDFTHAESWEFPVGAALTGVVYVRPRSDSWQLIPYAAYDDWLTDDRFAEALRIVTELGASEVVGGRIRSSSVRRITGDFKRRQSAGFAMIAAQIEDVTYHHVGSGAEPRDPAPLRWADQPGFAAARSAVLDSRASEVTMVVAHRTDFPAKSDLTSRLRRVGLTIGAGGGKHEEGQLHLAARFPQRSGKRR